MNPFSKKITAIFIPVNDIKKARDWYCDLLDCEPTNDFPGGHLYVIELSGINIVLDSKIFREETVLKEASFHFDTDDIQLAYDYIQSKGIELVTNIEHGHFFIFKDPDGNHLMLCQR